ncbi:eukaryotic translation initiation factor 4G-like protein isoform X3 [Cinnamomum micranthum f. kanehirae]|uniref:Eukaryotic translation initiation factor 4G n=1 Tax=Cinnamomum micranthum f. kanehirae TaxID=337451 RepID=A0A3S5WGN5_9MAGN|nr:eukaryotic translation initiation factor 4G-like protein isoform X3 [Cinnamomum micranthum f. kanehirae]
MLETLATSCIMEFLLFTWKGRIFLGFLFASHLRCFDGLNNGSDLLFFFFILFLTRFNLVSLMLQRREKEEEERGIEFMSFNQSRAERSESLSRRHGRSGIYSQQQRSFAGGGGAAPPTSPALSTNKSFKKSGTGQGGQSRMGPTTTLSSESNVVVATTRATPNGVRVQSQLHDVPVLGAGKPIDSYVPKSSRALPKAPSSQSELASAAADSSTPGTPSKGDVSKSFPLQFGSISPGFMNGMQIPARTTSAPPNLDEQKRDQDILQARHDSYKSIPTMSIPSAPKPQKKNVVSANQPNIVESHPSSQAKRDSQVQIPVAPIATTAQKSTATPIPGISMPISYQQPQIPLQFGGPGAQMQSQGIRASSLQLPMPLPVGNASQVQQQIFVPGLQSHPLQPQGMMHQGQSLGFTPQMGHQLAPQLGNLGIGVTSQFTPQQQVGIFGGPRRTVKITHPDTHEELKLDKRTDMHSDVGSSGPRVHPLVPPQSQPIQTFSPAHPINYYSPIQPNSYNSSMFFQSPTSLPLTSAQMTLSSSATRYNYPVGQGGPPISFVNPSVHNPLPVSKAGPPMHGITELANLEHPRDGFVVTPFAPSASVQVTVKPSVTPLAEKVVTSVTVSSSATKGESPKLVRQPSGEASVFSQQVDSEINLDSCLQQPKSIAESSDSMSLPVTVKHSASVPLHGLPPSPSPVPPTPVEESATAVNITEGQGREPVRSSNSLKDQKRRPSKKEPQLSQQQHQAGSSDVAGSLKSPLSKLSGDNSSSDDARQASINPEKRVGELTNVSSMPPNVEPSVYSSSDADGDKALTSTSVSSGLILEAAGEALQDAHAGSCDASTMLDDGGLDGEGDPCEPSKSVCLEADGNTSKKLDDSLLTKQNDCAMLDVGLKQETKVIEEQRNTRRPDGSSQDCSNSEMHSGSNVSEPTEGKEEEEVVPHVAVSDNVEEMNVGESSCAETKFVDVNSASGRSSEVVRTVDNLVRPLNISSSSIDGTTAPSHYSSTDALEYETSSAASKTGSERSTLCQEVAMTGSGILSQESTTAPYSASSEVTWKHEGRGTERTIGGQTYTSLLESKDKISMEQNRAMSSAEKKKLWKECLLKADAAGITSDLYLAYKGPEEKHETHVMSESVDSSAADVKQADRGDTKRNTVAVEDDGQNKSELDDWEDVAEIPTPKLKTSENRELVHGATKHDDEYGGKVMGKKKYTKDFLLTFSKQFRDLPVGFENSADIQMSGLVAAYVVDHDSHTSSGRIIDRPTGGSRLERHGSGIVDDRWGKAPGSFGSGRDPRVDITHGGVAISFRPGQAGSHGVLRNPCGQSSGQHIGGLLSAPMQALASPGGLARNSLDAARWQRSTGFQMRLIPAPQSPLQAMHKAEKKYEVGKASDGEQTKQRRVKAILNKLTPQNFKKLFEQVKEVNIDSAVTLTGVISQIFDKALMEPTFCEMYADFCYHLAGALPGFNEDNEKITFKRLLLNKCQEEFERGEREQAEANRVEEGEIKQSNEEREQKKVQARRRMLGNIRLIGELYKKKMLTERIMHECINKLLGQHQNPDEEDVEALCKLMSTIGEMIDHPKVKVHMDAYFDVMLKLSNNHKLSSRVRFMLKDAIDLRKNKWQQRRKVEGPKKIEEVHRDAAQERQLQTSRLSRGGPGISSVRRGQPIDYGPRGSTALFSLNPQQMSGLRSFPPQVRGYGTQDVRLEDRHSLESRMLSVPLPQRPIDDDSITLGPQGGLARGMSIRGQPLIASAPSPDVSSMTGDPRRMASGPNGYSSASDRAFNSREDLLPRYGPERFMAAHAYDKSNSVERCTSGGRDSRNADRAFDRSMATLIGIDHGSSTGVHGLPMESKMSEDHLRNKSISAIREYYSARNEDEVRLCIKEFNSPSFYPDMVMLWVSDSFECKNDIDRDLLAKLLVTLCKSRDGLLSQEQLIKGFEAVLSTLEDAVTDSPKAAEYLGRILGKVISENVVTLGEVGRIIHGGGKVLGTGLASDVLVTILEIIKQERGDSTLREMRMSSNLRLEDFRHPDPIKSRRLDAFM